MVSDDNNRTNENGAIGAGSSTSLMASTEHGIHAPQHYLKEPSTSSSTTMSTLLLATLNNENENSCQAPVEMNALQDIGMKRAASVLGASEIPPETKRIKVADDLRPHTPATKVELVPQIKITIAAFPPNQKSAIEPSISTSDGITAALVQVQEGGNDRSATTEVPTTIAAMPSNSTVLTALTSPSKQLPSAPRVQGTNPSTSPMSLKECSRNSSSVTFASSHSSSSSVMDAPMRSLAPAAPASQAPPLKSSTMSHLEQKYHAELEYMLREFRKLERQLLGAKVNGTGIEESAGSRERREKLHSFIMHLQDTITQVEVGCRLELEGKSTVAATTGEEERQQAANSAALTNLTKEKEEEENVQKLEEHILANLLPVKVRLKKQLAAQQGATRNPIGMPVARRGLQPPAAAEMGKGTFTAAAEERRKQAEAAREAAEHKNCMAMVSPSAPSQFGKPLTGGGSSLTQKLHGPTLGSQGRVHGHGVGAAEPSVSDPTTAPELAEVSEDAEDSSEPTTRKILYAGMAPGSNQHKSGVSAATGVHTLSMDTPVAKSAPLVASVSSIPKSPLATATPVATANPATKAVQAAPKPHPGLVPPKSKPKKPYDNPDLTEEEQKKVRKDRRKRKKARELRRREKERQRQLFLQQQAAQASQMLKGPMQGKKGGKGGAMMKGTSKKKGPRTVEYICALCSEAYSSSCDFNPWWALASHECPKCRKSQVPRIDITSPSNAIEYHPALLAHAEEGPGGGSAMGSAPPPSIMHHNMNPMPGFHTRPPTGSKYPSMYPLSDSDDESDLSELSDVGTISEDSEDTDDSEDEMPLTEGELAELEVFGKDYDGPKLTPDQSSRLMILMGHAQTCPGRHKSVKHRDCCNSVKYLMLHVRDCPGTTATFDVCPFPWCRKVKHLMYHLVACPRPRDCAICSPIALSPPLRSLIGLNSHRRKKHRERMKAVMAAAAAAAKAKPQAPRVAYVPKGSKPASYRPPVKKTTAAKYKVATAKHAGTTRVTPISRPGAKTVVRGLTLIKPSNGVVVKSLVKPVGRSVVILKARPQRPVIHATKPTVAALPGVEPTDSRSRAKDVPNPAISSIDAMTKPIVETIHVPGPIPTKAIASAELAQPVSNVASSQPITISVLSKLKSSATVVKACAAARSTHAVNALQQAALAMKSSLGTNIQVIQRPKSQVTPIVKSKEPVSMATMKMDSGASPAGATDAVPKSVSVSFMAVATASAIAAGMVTGSTAASNTNGGAKPTVAKEIPISSTAGAKPIVSKEEPAKSSPSERVPAPINVKPQQAAVATAAHAVSPVTSALESEQSDSSCDNSETHPSRKSSDAGTVAAAQLDCEPTKAVHATLEATSEPCTTTNAVKIEPTLNQSERAQQTSTRQSVLLSRTELAPVSEPCESQAQVVPKPAQILMDAGLKQEKLFYSTRPEKSPHRAPPPPRFPAVPAMVKQEVADEVKKEAPKAISPV